MKFLFVSFIFLGMVLAEDKPVVDWTPYEPTFGIFQYFWTYEYLTHANGPGSTCDYVFQHDAEWVISACQYHPDGQYVRSGCYYKTDTGDHYRVMESPCPEGTNRCVNLQADSHWGEHWGHGTKYPQMYAHCFSG